MHNFQGIVFMWTQTYIDFQICSSVSLMLFLFCDFMCINRPMFFKWTVVFKIEITQV